MSIVGTGTDIVECLRIGQMIEQHGEAFLRRVFTASEIEFCSARSRATQHYSAFWAAKNAVLRALGLKMRYGLSWRDMEIRTGKDGRTTVGLAGAAREASVALQVDKIHVSLAHCRSMATAHALAVRGTPEDLEIEF